MTSYEVHSIGKIRNTEEGTFLELEPQYIPAMKALDGFSHINVIWWFSDCDTKEARSVLETDKPYKSSPDKMGVFATRSPLRPNPIALTASEVICIDYEKGIIQIVYTDANDNTPVLDLKPYTPSLDRIENPVVPDWCAHWPKSLEKSGAFAWENEFNFQ